ncbi:protein FAR1-RELATED SEQUENCE 5-like [Camellia sinensis]|uniref:protein FAR1-RELATED SEQUENCE 5-like n=1 Tax=Camellia sinensis TaxID=4442 RepID=UPI001035B61D|nr:protein FAR1-RELATED SEQUENCE 5-like [Camellia sinensis]
MEPENDCDWKPKLGMIFDSEQCAYEFYNTYGGRMGFSIRRDYCKKDKFTNQLIHRLLVCNKEGFRKVDKRDPLSKNSRAETRSGCEARLYINYMRVLENNEEQITNMFWADAQMIMDYAQFGDVVTFDTTYKLNKEHRPFESFVGFNHHRETVIFGAALLYDETAESFVWLFEKFLEAMSRKAPKTLFTDQDAAMAKAIPIVMPDTSHRLCTWHLMQNALKHVNCLFQDKGVKGVLNKFFFHIEDTNQWKLEWAEMLDKYDAHENHWLKLTFAVKEKWGWPYVRSTWAAGMSTTQLSESFNAFLKDYIRSDFNLNEFFMHFERVLYEKRYKELEAGYALCQRLTKVKATIRMLIQMGNVYTKKIFEEFQNEYFKSIESNIEAIEYGEASTIYTVVDVGNKHARKVKLERDGSLGCNCTKFEREGILCSHSLKVIRDILKMKEVPSQYILKRWTKQARAETVQHIKENDIQVDVKFQQASRYKTLMTAFRAVASRAAETEETYDFCIAYLATLGADVEGKVLILVLEMKYVMMMIPKALK